MKRVLFCPDFNHFPTHGIADSDVWDNEAGRYILGNGNIGVIVDNSGKATNQWSDGTVGVDDEAKKEAETDDEPRCGEHPDSFCTWKDVK